MNSQDYAMRDIKQVIDYSVVDGHLTSAQADKLELMVKQHFAKHWRDDDSPQSETTFGVKRQAEEQTDE